MSTNIGDLPVWIELPTARCHGHRHGQVRGSVDVEEHMFGPGDIGELLGAEAPGLDEVEDPEELSIPLFQECLQTGEGFIRVECEEWLEPVRGLRNNGGDPGRQGIHGLDQRT